MVQPHYSLSQILTIVQKTFSEIMSDFSFFVVVECSKIQQVGKNTYGECVEYSTNGKVLAKARFTILSPQIIKTFCEKTATSVDQLKGMKLLLKAKCAFHPEYGFSLMVNEISHQYTLGQIQQQQQDVLIQLEKMGIKQNNHQKHLGLPPFDIAVISSATSEGLKDFRSVLEQSGYHYTLIPYYAAVHGNSAQVEVYQALQRIFADIREGKKIDCVALIRGGGGTSGILWQNTIDIAKGICYMQVPVIVAIGHTSDKSILDHICRFSCKTPTDAAYVLIKSYQQYQQELESLRESIQTQCNQQTNTINNNINILYQTIEQTIKQKFCTLNNMCQERYQTIQQFVPHHLLKRGYALIYDQQGQIISFEKQKNLRAGSRLRVQTHDYRFEVTIDNIEALHQ